MAFRTYQELIDNVKKNPQLAKQRIVAAAKNGQSPVSPRNPGYGNPKSNNTDPRQDAIKKRLSKGSMPKKINRESSRDRNSAFKDAVKNRIKGRYTDTSAHKIESEIITPQAEAEIVTRRKKVGY